MKYIAAYMLAKLGNENPTIEDIKRIIESVGIEFDEKKAEEIVSKLAGKDLNQVIDNGKSKLSVVSNSAAQNDQQPSSKENHTEEANNNKEEEETLELGGGFDDLFN
ncbi:60S acidic ribosomal protein P2 [Tritrichomonas musculus]|uniref:60S acidic ribosomal protein P2 n=1 Tax=Tritrichomonas musculus TaxID=1915356 RepID=A0ABR2H7K2_9EUKA